MKAISLWQPWASLVAVGAKTVETRHWPTRYRGPLAIHAAVRNPVNDEFQGEVFELMVQALGVSDFRMLPLGRVVAVAELAQCHEVREEPGVYLRRYTPLSMVRVSREIAFGNFATGRFGWILRDVRHLKQSVIARGHQGFWELDAAAAALVEQQLAGAR